MYNFIDVNEALEENVLPSEALKINGNYIEDLIYGYRTLSVSGREALSPDVQTFETGYRDGTRMKSKRYPERIITVTYQLIAKSNKEFREAYNTLGKILDVTDAQLIFNDEPDKYYTGTPCTIGSVPPGKNAVIGEFEILCTDPFKYSISEHIATAEPGFGSLIFNNGTYKSFPKLQVEFFDEAENGENEKELTGEGDCGYVAFFNEDRKIIQLGDPGEADGESGFEKSQTLINQTFLSETSWGTTAQELWKVNQGHIMATNMQQAGSVYMGVASSGSSNTSGETSGTLLSRAGSNPVYKAVYSTKNRTKNTVDVVVTVSASVDSVTAAGITIDSIITAGITIRGIGHPVDIKRLGEQWESNKTYSASIRFTVSGLIETETALTATLRVWSQSAYSSVDLSSTNCNPLIISPYSSTGYSKYYLCPNSYGTVTGKWHGPTICRSLGADAAGNVGAKDFTLTYKQKMCISQSGGTNQIGSFRMNITDQKGRFVAGVWIYKNKAGNGGKLIFYVGGKKVNETDIDIHHGNDFFGKDEDKVKSTVVEKYGSTVSFAVGSYKRKFTDSSIADIVATQVTFSFEKYSDLEALAYNGLYTAKFVKHNCDNFKDVPNKFGANDILIADCNNAVITLNGTPMPDLGALGNNWEEFYLKPGSNHIGVSYSDWVTDEYAPKFKIIFREVFL